MLRFPSSLLAREGEGDYRHPVLARLGSNGGRSVISPGSPHHNPVHIQLLGEGRNEHAEAEYIARQNGRPVFRPYVWRAPGWEDRLARFGLDLAELAQADAEVGQVVSDRRHELSGAVRRYRRR